MANNTMTSAKNQLVLSVIEARRAYDVYAAIEKYVEACLHMEFEDTDGASRRLEYRGNEIIIVYDRTEGNITIKFEYDVKSYSIRLYKEGGANFFRRKDDDPSFPYYNEHAYWVDQQVRRVFDTLLDVLQEEYIWRWE